MKKIGIALLIVGIIILANISGIKDVDSIPKLNLIIGYIIAFIFIISGGVLYSKVIAKENQINKLRLDFEAKSRIKLNDDYKLREEKSLDERISRLETLKFKMESIKEIEEVSISDFKKFIEENQKAILQKGNDEVLFSFLKIDSFLNEYKQGMESYKNWVIKNIDVEDLKSKLIQDFQSNNLDKLSKGFQANLNRLEGKRPTGFNASFDNLLSVGHVFKETYENNNKTLEYYKNIAKTMIIFYLNDNKISYFEIHQAFEKLGVFDSTWQKNLMSKMSNIESNLDRISHDLTQMNSNFKQLINQSEKITNELQAINSSFKTGNMIQAISAYQLWRVNRKISN